MKLRSSLAGKLIILLTLSSILPLAFYGVISLWQARSTAEKAVIVGNYRIAERVANEINQYVQRTLAGARLIGEDIDHPDFKDWQRERTLREVVLEFQEYRELSLFDIDGKLTTTSAVGTARLAANPYINEAISTARRGEDYLSEVFITDELTPAMVAAFPLIQLGSVTSVMAIELDLLHMWRLVGGVKIGQSGYLNVMLRSGKLIASGNGELKKLVLQEKDYPKMELVHRTLERTTETPDFAIRNGDEGELLVSAAELPQPLGWIAMVEQPSAEAYALAHKMTRQLIILVATCLILVCLIGYFGVRWQVLKPIRTLIAGTRAVANGDLNHRVPTRQRDEFGELAFAFNQMTSDLTQLQDNIRRQERMATFGRIASGLVHDLKHPVKSIENASRLMDRMYEDAEYRKTFVKTVDREFEKINNFLSNLHTLTHDIPFHPIRLKVKQLIDDAMETFRMEAGKNKVQMKANISDDSLIINADKISVGRAISNVISNAIQAMPQGGELNVDAQPWKGADGDWIRIRVSDTGCGIPKERLSTVFGDFVTTKRRGLGLGLALTKRILDQHGAIIDVHSEVGKGTTFDILFPVQE